MQENENKESIVIEKKIEKKILDLIGIDPRVYSKSFWVKLDKTIEEIKALFYI